MCEIVPTTTSSSSWVTSAASRTSPRSRITTRPSFATRTFDGLMSRWTFPAACSAMSPCVSCASDSRSLVSSATRAVRTSVPERTPLVTLVPVEASSLERAVDRSATRSVAPVTYATKPTPSTSSIVKNQLSASHDSSNSRIRFRCSRS
jgi:hypothetical protein